MWKGTPDAYDSAASGVRFGSLSKALWPMDVLALMRAGQPRLAALWRVFRMPREGPAELVAVLGRVELLPLSASLASCMLSRTRPAGTSIGLSRVPSMRLVSGATGSETIESLSISRTMFSSFSLSMLTIEAGSQAQLKGICETSGWNLVDDWLDLLHGNLVLSRVRSAVVPSMPTSLPTASKTRCMSGLIARVTSCSASVRAVP